MPEQQEDIKKPQRLSKLDIILMIVVAIILDVVSIIPVLGIVLAYLIFGIWFYMKDIPLISFKKIMTYAGTLIGESIAAFSIGPWITIGVIFIITITVAEDKTGLSLSPSIKRKLSKSSIKPSSK